MGGSRRCIRRSMAGCSRVRENEAHLKALADHAIHPIDLLAANLYPFEQTVAGGADFDTCIETIDIGGPAMIRAGAKNHDGVTVVVDPADYALRDRRDGRAWRRDDARLAQGARRARFRADRGL